VGLTATIFVQFLVFQVLQSGRREECRRHLVFERRMLGGRTGIVRFHGWSVGEVKELVVCQLRFEISGGLTGSVKGRNRRSRSMPMVGRKVDFNPV
jgi:hypothetical protein